MKQPSRTGQRLFVLFLGGCLIFNYPLLALFSREQMIRGIPLLYVVIFSAWLALIGLIAVVIEWR